MYLWWWRWRVGDGRRAEFPPVKSRRFSWPYPTHLQWILIHPLLGVDWFCDPHANLYCQPFVITVPCKTATLKIWGVPQINGLEQAGTLPCTLVPVSEIETAVWPAIDISKLPASICSKRQICWDSCDLCFRFISKNIAKIVNGTFSEVAIWMILILVLKWQYQNKLNNSYCPPTDALALLDH